MSRALIGHTGFVGGNLLAQASFDHRYRSTDIEEIRGRSFELVVCCGAPAVKWKANQEPEADLANLERLMGCLGEVEADHVVLVSTVDVYPDPVGVDEATPVEDTAGGAYGRHRRLLERFVEKRFDTTTVRLPGLFGPGLKKNVIYDFLHANRLEAICAESQFQFYPLGRLWADIETARGAGVPLVNFATEPVAVADVARVGFGLDFANPEAGPPVHYDMRTRHAALFGGRDGYLVDAAGVLAGIAAWADDHGWDRAAGRVRP